MRIDCAICKRQVQHFETQPRDDLPGNKGQITVWCHGASQTTIIDLDALPLEDAEAIDNGDMVGVAFAPPGLVAADGIRRLTNKTTIM